MKYAVTVKKWDIDLAYDGYSPNQDAIGRAITRSLPGDLGVLIMEGDPPEYKTEVWIFNGEDPSSSIRAMDQRRLLARVPLPKEAQGYCVDSVGRDRRDLTLEADRLSFEIEIPYYVIVRVPSDEELRYRENVHWGDRQKCKVNGRGVPIPPQRPTENEEVA